MSEEEIDYNFAFPRVLVGAGKGFVGHEGAESANTLINLPENPTQRPSAAIGARVARRKCLLLHVEPTTYVSHKLKLLKDDQEYDFEVYFATANRSQNWGLGNSDGEVLNDRGVSLVTRAGRVFGLARKILSGKFSVALLAGWGTPLLLLFSLVLKLSGTPFCYDSDTQLAQDRRGIKETAKSTLYPILFRFASALLPAGTRQAEFFKAYGVSPDRIHVQHMTVDVNQIRNLPKIARSEFRRANDITEEAVIFIFVGRLERIKALDILFAAFERILANCHECVLVIVGDGLLRDEALALSARLPSVRYIGRQGFEGVMQWMRASDVFVLPSYVDQWGLVMNEAMACGLPLIASDRVGSVDDLVIEGCNGLVIRAGDIDGLTAAMLNLARDPDLRKRMGEASQRMIAPWTLEAEVANIKQVLALVGR